MKLFHREREAKPLAPTQERTAIRIAESILRVQRSAANWLNIQGRKLGMFKVRLILGALLLGFAFYCGYLLLASLF